MLIKTIEEENFNNYKKVCMLIGTAKCDFKCCKEQNLPLSTCQNNSLFKQETKEISNENILNKYMNNSFSSSIVIGGLEPFLQFDEILNFIKTARVTYKIEDDIVIYTGYYPDEINKELEQLKKYKNIYIKFGRFIPDHEPHFDEVLGINLASDNQIGVKIS